MINHKKLDQLFDTLFPICRSISGEGFRQSIEILQQYIPLELESVDSGSEVFDWTVPPEWNIREAVLTGPDGKTVVDFIESNLHVVNYSTAVDKTLDLEELKPHLHSIKNLPEAIPYVTSYYKKNWGFCMSHRQFEALKPGRYHVRIDSDHNESGELNFAQCLLEGAGEKEILLTSYLCHPSMANNELSGPLVLLGLYDRISRWQKRRFSYRFLINPETIGSICFLQRYGEALRQNLFSGLVLTCLGGQNPFLSYQFSRRTNSPFDQLVKTLNQQEETNFRLREFNPTRGSDERQYCSAGFNLPMGQFGRDVYHEYEGYHNSLDDKSYMGIDQLIDSIDQIERFLKRAETSGKFQNLQPFGEPQLGKRGLYPSINSPNNKALGSDDGSLTRRDLDLIRFILCYSDEQHDMSDIAKKAGCTLAELSPLVNRLEDAGLLKISSKH